jgi:hypothetical protein
MIKDTGIIEKNGTDCTIGIDLFKERHDMNLFVVPLQWDAKLRIAIRHPRHEATKIPPFSDIERMYLDMEPVTGIAIKLLPPFGMFDFDEKHNPEPSQPMIKSFLRIVEAERPCILKKVCIETTRSGGCHVYFKYPVSSKIMLARNEQGEETISIYANGLLSYSWPTPGYEAIHNDFTDIETLQEEEFNFLMEVSRTFNKYEPKPSDYTPGTLAIYPEVHDQILSYFDRHCPDQVFENCIREQDLHPTGKKKTKEGRDYHFYLRKGSTADFSAKVCFSPKRLLVFSGSITNLPNFHSRQGHDDREWVITPSKLIYYCGSKNWDDVAARVTEIMRIHDVPLPELMPPPVEYNTTTEEIHTNDSAESSQGEIKTLEDYEASRITREKFIRRLPPFLTIGVGKVAAAGNIVVISGAVKAGKTAVREVILAGGISRTGELDGFPEFNVLPNPEGKAVLDFDCEQSPEDQQDLVNRVLNRNKFTRTPDNYYSYNTLELSISDYQPFTNNICRLASEKHGGIHMIIVDGGADYIADSNDLKESQAIVRYFRSLSVLYNCPVFVIIHTNPGSDKERGHAGSEFQRRCYGLLTVVKNGDISTLQPKIMRKAGIGDIPLISFIYSKEKQYHVAMEQADPDNCSQKDHKEKTRIMQLAEKVFAPPGAYRHKDAVSRIMQAADKKTSTAKNLLGDMEGFGFIVKSDDGYYRLNIEKVNAGQKGSS